MSADDAAHLGLQFSYRQVDGGGSIAQHKVEAHVPEEGRLRQVGEMLWNRNRILTINVTPGMQRQGVATALWGEGHRLAGEVQRIPRPKHSTDRTDKGDAWARSVGGRLPRRTR